MGKRQGPLDNNYLEEIAGRARACEEMLDLPYEAVVQFYQPVEEASNEAEIVQDEYR